jgi:hypothetical protein
MSKVWYGSLQNRLEESARMPEPKVGMGATEYNYSDREPYEIVEVLDARHIVVRPMNAKRIDHNGLSECQEYEYTSNPEAYTINLFLTKQGRWRERYPSGHLGCDTFGIGHMEKYCDPCF